MPRSIAIAAVVAVMVATPVLAQQDRTERVQFARGAASKAISGAIRGYAGVNYIVGARAGQVMHVTLQASNASAYFNIWAPGADEALFVGSSTGNRFSGALPADGDYRIQVYLMRNAARRNERANYTVTVGVR